MNKEELVVEREFERQSKLDPKQVELIVAFGKALRERKTPLCCLVHDEHHIAEGKMCQECLYRAIDSLAQALKEVKARNNE